MKIAILGTSNSIKVNGYANIYKAIEYPHQVDNFSLGGSYNQYGLLANELYKISENYDVVILDFVINDYERCNIFSKEIVSSDLFSLLVQFKKKCKLIYLIFCANKEWNKEYSRNVTIKLCEELNIPYINVYSCLKSILNKKEPVFDDVIHISSFYSRLLAMLLKQKRIEITSLKYKMKNSLKDYLLKQKLPNYNFFIKSAEDIKKENIISPSYELGSSFITHTVCEISQNIDIQLSIQQSYLIGILGYFDKMSGWITINNYNKLFTREVSRYGTFFFKSIKNPIYIKNKLQLASQKK